MQIPPPPLDGCGMTPGAGHSSSGIRLPAGSAQRQPRPAEGDALVAAERLLGPARAEERPRLEERRDGGADRLRRRVAAAELGMVLEEPQDMGVEGRALGEEPPGAL